MLVYKSGVKDIKVGENLTEIECNEQVIIWVLSKDSSNVICKNYLLKDGGFLEIDEDSLFIKDKLNIELIKDLIGNIINVQDKDIKSIQINEDELFIILNNEENIIKLFINSSEEVEYTLFYLEDKNINLLTNRSFNLNEDGDAINFFNLNLV